MEEMVKYLFSTSMAAVQPPRRAQTTLAPNFYPLVNMAGRIEQAVQEGKERSVGGSIVNRAAHDHTVSAVQLCGNFIDQIIKYTAVRLIAAAAAYTAPDQVRADFDDFGFDAALVENILHLSQGKGSIALFMGAAVE